jgi:hypothetical protein
VTRLQHLEQIIGRTANVEALQEADLQRCIERRAKVVGLHGHAICAAAMRIVKRPFANRGLRYPQAPEEAAVSNGRGDQPTNRPGRTVEGTRSGALGRGIINAPRNR